MSDRYHALTVVLETDTKDEDAQRMIQSISMIRGVLSVTPHVAGITLHTAEMRAQHDLGQKVLRVIYPPIKQ